MATQKIDPRSMQVLKDLIERYIAEGEPVGSKTLAQESILMVSSATIRHIMSDLEKLGYLTSAHTSAGRVPTAKGYRLFVDNFLTVQEMDQQKLMYLQQQFSAEANLDDMVSQVSALLSGVTKLAGVVTLPKCDQLILKQVEFLPLSEQRVLVILVVNQTEVQNRVIQTERQYSASELEQAGNYLTQHYAGKDLLHIRDTLLHEMREDREHLDKMMQLVMEMAESATKDDAENHYVLSGQTNLLDAVDIVDVAQLRKLFDAFEDKRDILHLLDRSLHSQGLQIFIGEESGYQMFDDFSIVTSTYSSKGKVVGVLGVIGPTRMPYNQVISAVDMTAKLLTQVLE